jgi:hypothetical protein
MSRQGLAEVIGEGIYADLTAITATTETGLWGVTSGTTGIPAFDPKVGKIYKVIAGGIMSTAASGTLIITPRWGTTTGGVTLGASVTQTVPINLSAVAWRLEFELQFRTINNITATQSTAVGTGIFHSAGTAATAGSAFSLTFGGTAGTVDTTSAQGIFIGWTLSVAGSVTPKFVYLQSLN